MWRMHDGNRVLRDAEWELFAAGLEILRDLVEGDISGATNHTQTGVGVFDALTAEQKLALLADVASALRDPAVPMPQHTATNEGAIAAVFESVRGLLESELLGHETGEARTEIRELLLAAARASDAPPKRLPAPERLNPAVWANLLGSIVERVLWDTDYALEDAVLDLPPETSRTALETLMIEPQYFLAVPRDPDRAGLIAARQVLARLLGLPVPDDNRRSSAD
jgi:hypothetical protein